MVSKGETKIIEETKTLPVAEERAQIAKRTVPTGKIRISTPVEVRSEFLNETLVEHKIDIKRVPVNRVIDNIPTIRTENDVTIIPVVEEILVVEKQLVLREELHVRRQVTEERVEIPVSLRSQRAVVERLEADTPAAQPLKHTLKDQETNQ